MPKEDFLVSVEFKEENMSKAAVYSWKHGPPNVS